MSSFFTYQRIKGKKRWKSNICFEKYTFKLIFHPIFLHFIANKRFSCIDKIYIFWQLLVDFNFLPEKKDTKRWSGTQLFHVKKIVSEFLISQDKNFCQIPTLLILSKIINLKSSSNFDLNWKEVIQYSQNNKIAFLPKVS